MVTDLKKNKWVAFVLLALTALLPLSVRDPYLVSDSANYVAHAGYEVDFSQPIYYLSPFYWVLVRFFGSMTGDAFVSLLSIIVSLMVILSALTLHGRDRYIFLFFCLASPIIFNLTQVSLRNGLAIGLILLALGLRKNVFLVMAPFVHPGVVPMVVILIVLRYLSEGRRWIWGGAGVVGVLLLSMPLFEAVLEVRGYEGQGGSSIAGGSTYFAFFSLAVLYVAAIRNNPYRFFMPIMIFIWIVVGLKYEFGGRLFLQAVPVSLFLVLRFSFSSKYKKLFIWVFFGLTIYGAILWHPFTEYWAGWPTYWAAYL